MKKLILTSIVAFGTIVCASAQTNTGKWYAPLLNATNYATIPYVDYFENNHQVGYGLFVEYNIFTANNGLGVASGVGLDYAGIFRSVSGNVEGKWTSTPWKSSNNAWLQQLAFTGGGIVAMGTPLSGSGTDNGGMMTAEGAYADANLYTWKGGEDKVGLGYAGIYRQGAGDYNGLAHTIFVRIQLGF